jgi:hypothetical protein
MEKGLCLVRRERTRAELERLAREIREWVGRCQRVDVDSNQTYVGRHKTQIDTLERVLGGAAQALSGALPSMEVAESAEKLYDACRDIDLATSWLRHLYEFFGTKFDQRHADAAVLRAADEIIWSAYQPVLGRGRSTGQRHVAPLPFLSPDYSPTALHAHQPLAGKLRLPVDFPGWDEPLKALVLSLPLPLIGIPMWYRDSPWWLLTLVHEVGHHAQSDLELIGPYQDIVRSAVAAVSPAHASQWSQWSAEIFADFYAVMLTGRWWVWALADAERTDAAEQYRSRRTYPSPGVRLALCAVLVDRLGFGGTEALADASWEISLDPLTTQLVEAVVATAWAPFPGGTSLAQLCSAHAVEEKQIRYWRTNLQSAAPPVPLPGVAIAIACGAFAASIEIAKSNDLDHPVILQQLAAATHAILYRSAPLGTRGEKQSSAPDISTATTLADSLRQSARRYHAVSGS